MPRKIYTLKELEKSNGHAQKKNIIPHLMIILTSYHSILLSKVTPQEIT